MTKENLGNDRLTWMYTQMARIREFEEHVKRTFVEHPGTMRGHTHLADGAEASIVGALATRNPTDFVMPTYRCHGQAIVVGSPPRNLMAELYGRKDGVCKGFGGSMHLADPERYFPGTSAIVGQSIAHAAGAALTAQVKNTGQIVYCFFGDGAAKQGAFFETLNMAAVWKLPVIFILENNDYQAYTHVSLEDANAVAGDPLSKKAAAFSIPGVTVDGTDPLKVYAEVQKAAERARSDLGPTLIESKFYRLSAHGNAITVPPCRHNSRSMRRSGFTATRANSKRRKRETRCCSSALTCFSNRLSQRTDSSASTTAPGRKWMTRSSSPSPVHCLNPKKQPTTCMPRRRVCHGK